MSRGQRGNFDSGGHSLSMLAVLLCAAGALVVLLSAVGRHNRLHAPVAQAPSEDMQAAREVLNWRVEQLKEAREKTAAQLREDRLKLSHLEDHSRRLREQLARLVASADQLQNVGAASTEYKRREAQHELEEIRRLIARTQDELAAMKQKGQGKSTAFSIVPYVGPNGTRRRPIFIECRSESIIIQPENIILGEGDFLGPMGPGNPLASALRALREYLVEQQAALAAEKMEPYPLLLVRPDGILMYYAARNALSTWGNEFGYELIEQHWELKYPDPDPQQADLVRRVIDDARVKQRQLALSAPRHFGKNGSGNGKTAYRASARGGFVPDTSGGSRNSGGSPGAGGGLAGRPRSPGGSGRSSSGGGVAGGVASQGGATGERTAGQSGNSAPQQPSFADEPFAMNDKAKGSSSAASNGPSSSGDPGGEEKTRDKKPPVKSLSESRGTDWGLPDAARGAVAVSRPVAVYCYPDRLIIMPERGIGGGKTIMMSGGTQDSVDELVAGVWEHIKTWGIAGKGLYWKPTLSMDVQPGAAGRYSDLESLLQDSGLDVKQRGARSPETAAPNAGAPIIERSVFMLDFFKNQRSTASPSPDLNSGGQFSLFGIVGHVVGLLIVLVMVAGARAKLLPAIENVNAAAQSELDAARNAATSMERDVNAIVDERTTISRVALELQNERNQLAALVAAAEQDLAARRAALDVQSRQQYDSDRDLALAKMDLEKLANQRAQSVVETKTVATKIDSYPTPLSKTVDGKECHFQLKNGRISPIPLEALLKKFRTVASEKAWRLSENNNEMTDTIGPINGFNMRYTLVRVDIQEPGRSGSLIQLDHWEIIPVSSQLGETLDVALGNRSLFRATLDTISARDWTVTVWVYPDSFAEFRRIRKELYLLGFATAGRPLPPDSPIGGSPTGSKSAAQ